MNVASFRAGGTSPAGLLASKTSRAPCTPRCRVRIALSLPTPPRTRHHENKGVAGFGMSRLAFTPSTASASISAAGALPPIIGEVADISPVFELAARGVRSSVPSDALAALVLATALIAILGRDENNLLLATIAYRAMSVGSIVQWWLGPTGHAVAFGVLAIKTFLAGAGVGVRTVRFGARTLDSFVAAGQAVVLVFKLLPPT